jgi:hypothetical protein
MFIGVGSTNIMLSGNKSRCPFCGSLENIPDGTFNAAVHGFIDILKGADNPLQEAINILKDLERARNNKSLSDVSYGEKIEQLLKKNKIKIGIAIVVIKVIIDLMTTNQNVKIDNININQKFYNQYNQYINIENNK